MRAILTLVLLAAATAPASAELLIYEGFNYPSGSALVGQVNLHSGETWGSPGSPAQSDTHKVAADDVSAPGLPNLAAGSLVVPPTPNATISRIALPLPAGEDSYNVNSPTGPSLFFSFTLKLTDAAPSTGTDYFFAGFHWNGSTGGMAVAGGYGGQMHLRPSPTSAGTGADQEYELGISKNNATGFSIAWAEDKKFKADSDTLFVVGQYEFVGAANANGGDDVVRLWVNPTPGDLAAAASPDAFTATGPDVFASSQNALRSFWFRSDSNVSGVLHVDELRVGTSFASVSVPEPSSLTAAAAGMLLTAARRRRTARKIA